ncbi:MAG: queuosine precursor transporter [Patescibacteria group bacterium]|nr:queuosine precursor transporter [Patescibacteria group bacterium]
MDLETKGLKYFDVITGLFVAILIISNIASAKVASLGPFNYDAGTILFPVSYIFGDVLTEVYGYRKSRRVIWLGFACLVLMAITFAIVQYLPPARDWQNQAAYETILGFVPRLVLASIAGYWAGEFTNSFVLAKMKIWTKGRYLWTRTIGSTIAGEALDSLVFGLCAFYGTMPLPAVINLMATIYVFKVLIEVVATPLTYAVIGYLKITENSDTYDIGTNFNPFRINA